VAFWALQKLLIIIGLVGTVLWAQNIKKGFMQRHRTSSWSLVCKEES
jgi:hypothetical protein